MSYVPTVVVGPSGVGKGTVLASLGTQYPQVWLSISATTRPPRPHEVDGQHYFFLTMSQFDDLIDSDGLLEWAVYQGQKYGTPSAEVARQIEQGRAVVMELDIQGARQVEQRMNPVRTIFLAPPTLADLEQRLRGRGTESEEAIQGRLAHARQEIAAMGECDHVVYNDQVASAVAELVSLIGLGSDQLSTPVGTASEEG